MEKLKDKIKGFLKKGGHVAAKIAMAPSRGAFLIAVKTNLFKLAKRLKQANEKNPEGVEKFWSKFGGKYKNLNAEINKGLKHMNKHHVSGCIGAIDEKSIYSHNSELGVILTITAAVAAAAPILRAAMLLFKKSKSDSPEDKEHDKENMVKIANQLLTGGSVGVKIVATNKEGKQEVIDHGKDPDNKKYLIYGAGAVALVGGYLLLNKR